MELSDLTVSQNNEEKSSLQEVNRVKQTEELIPSLIKAWEQYQDEEGWVNIATVGHFLKRIKPDFDPRSYGYQKVPQIVETLNNNFEMRKVKGKGVVPILAYRPKN